MTDGVRGPGVSLRPTACVFRVPEVRQHVYVQRVQPQVERVAMGVPAGVAVMHPQSAAVGLRLRLEDAQAVSGHVVATEFEWALLRNLCDSFGPSHGLLFENAAAQLFHVAPCVVPRQRGHAGVGVERETVHKRGGAAASAPSSRPSEIAYAGVHGVEAVYPRANQEALLELGIFPHQIMRGVRRIESQRFSQSDKGSAPMEPVVAALITHAVAVDFFDQHQRDGGLESREKTVCRAIFRFRLAGPGR